MSATSATEDFNDLTICSRIALAFIASYTEISKIIEFQS
jgi:hypothetical protein